METRDLVAYRLGRPSAAMGSTADFAFPLSPREKAGVRGKRAPTAARAHVRTGAAGWQPAGGGHRDLAGRLPANGNRHGLPRPAPCQLQTGSTASRPGILTDQGHGVLWVFGIHGFKGKVDVHGRFALSCC